MIGKVQANRYFRLPAPQPTGFSGHTVMSRFSPVAWSYRVSIPS